MCWFNIAFKPLEIKICTLSSFKEIKLNCRYFCFHNLRVFPIRSPSLSFHCCFYAGLLRVRVTRKFIVYCAMCNSYFVIFCGPASADSEFDFDLLFLPRCCVWSVPHKMRFVFISIWPARMWQGLFLGIFNLHGLIWQRILEISALSKCNMEMFETAFDVSKWGHCCGKRAWKHIVTNY